MSRRPGNSEATGSTSPSCFRRIVLAGALTFAVPAVQWLVNEVAAPWPYRGWLSSLTIILCAGLWYGKSKARFFLPASHFWRVFGCLGGIAGLGLLTINLFNQPVSKISGQARSPFDVIDVILLVPLAEELIFRGLLWSFFEGTTSSGRMIALAATSLLFGIEHLGYWAQAGWPLPPEAVLHALSMVGAGLCFGALRWRSRSLAVPAAVHLLANGAILLTQ
ncbi:MAG: CPBP family intramembrane metalloprotease [Anaerolineales bacterium]|nr:CPBP family intramembrane metalloprotease [Anaerolineales bacterium]